MCLICPSSWFGLAPSLPLQCPSISIKSPNWMKSFLWSKARWHATTVWSPRTSVGPTSWPELPSQAGRPLQPRPTSDCMASAGTALLWPRKLECLSSQGLSCPTQQNTLFLHTLCLRFFLICLPQPFFFVFYYVGSFYVCLSWWIKTPSEKVKG